MSLTLRLDDDRRHCFAEAVESAMAVRSRQQFFVWTQSAVQGLLPHQILICGVRDAARDAMVVQHFSASRYFRQAQFDAVANPLNGLLPRLLAAAHSLDDGVVLVDPAQGDSGSRSALQEMVQDNELQNLAARLILGSQGRLEAFYGFARVPVLLDAGLRHALLVLSPHLHEAFVRVLQHEHEQQQPQPSATPRAARVVTQRQQEILLLIKDGKTNSEIAHVLACSPWTVKNHVQNILHRLGSTSRAHALARAMSLGILRPD